MHRGGRKATKSRNVVSVNMAKEIIKLHGVIVPIGSGLYMITCTSIYFRIPMNSFEFTIKRKIVLMAALKKLRLFSFHTVAICSVCRKYHKSTVDQSPWVAEEIEDNAEDAGTMEGIANRCERNFTK